MRSGSPTEQRGRTNLAHDHRALSPVVGKTLEVALVVVFLSLVTTALYGGIVPQYRTAAGSKVADRTLSAAADRLEATVPPNATHVDARLHVDLPRTIRGETYRVRANGSALVLDHPNPALDGRVRLALPSSVARVSGEWRSDRPAVVAINDVDGGLDMTLEVGSS